LSPKQRRENVEKEAQKFARRFKLWKLYVKRWKKQRGKIGKKRNRKSRQFEKNRLEQKHLKFWSLKAARKWAQISKEINQEL
jgi:hypothetical protein